MKLQSDFPEFINWLRQSAAYIRLHRGKTFVVLLGGEAVISPNFTGIVNDLALLHSLGVRLVLVHGARPQIESQLREVDAAMRYVNGLRVTDDMALACVKEAVGIVRVEIEARLSLSLANSPMAHAQLRVVSGNFLTARPLGVREGVDYLHTGEIRKLDRLAIRQQLDLGNMVLLQPLGYSPTGEVFNLSAHDVAVSAASALGADKLLVLMEEADYLQDAVGQRLHELTLPELALWLQGTVLTPALRVYLQLAQVACQQGVPRVHLLNRQEDGALLNELLTRDGTGTLVSAAAFEQLRGAQIDDVGGILALIQPLEAQGILVRRSRERLEMEIAQFVVLERDGLIVGCAALYPYPAEQAGEFACLAVHPDYRDADRGERLLQVIEQRARQSGLRQLFALTTHTAQWLQERGFVPTTLHDLPVARQKTYNYQRKSRLLIKPL